MKARDLAMAPFEMQEPRIKFLKAFIQEACPAKATEEWTVEGRQFGIRLGPRAKERTVNIPKLVKAIGAAVYAKFATCTLKALEDNVNHDMVEAVVTTDNTGPRKLATFEKGIHLVVDNTRAATR